ncbi:Potassium voltage-gated channel subfamily H member 2 [Symbiodinium microadriaticum]|uniref:Potassium voltage-gated channel subfamily H member 2 n=1 Tax=Symbiodinium microadriaticum TaxID=2951 RepID=A0A1Q9EPB5_SYMMI|nr:Potassium voltage-gated channel subfamily H member 2 [Symbiodinium microadriaticum]
MDSAREEAPSNVVNFKSQGSRKTYKFQRSLQPQRSLQFEESEDEEEPSEPALVERHRRLGWIVQRSDSRLRQLWTLLILLLLMYTGTIFLYRMTFVRSHAVQTLAEPEFWSYWDRFVDVVFVVDVVVPFFFSYVSSDGKEVVSLRRIARRYILGNFTINLISSLPEPFVEALVSVALAEDINSNQANRALRIIRMQQMTKLLKYLRVVKLIQLVEWVKHYKFVAVLNLLLGLIWLVHVLACGWYLCAALHDDHMETWLAFRLVNQDQDMLLYRPPMEQWIHAVYFVFTVFTTVGFGDFSVKTLPEVLYVCFTMLIGTVMHSIIVGKVISEVSQDTELKTLAQHRQRLVAGFMQHARLRGHMAKSLQNWVRHGLRDVPRQHDLEEMQQLIITDMPLNLAREMHGSLFDGELARNAFLTHPTLPGIPARLPLLLSVVLVPKLYEQAQIVYQKGDPAFHMYLILRGTFAFVATPVRDHHKRKSQRLSRGDGVFSPYQLFSFHTYFGDLELQSEITLHRPGTVRCELAGEVLRLPKGDYTNLCRDFPQYATVWRNYSLRREARRQRLRQQHSASLSYDHWAATQIQRFLRSAKSGVRKLSKLSSGNAERSHSADLNELMLSPRGYRNSNSSTAAMMELSALRAEMSQAKAREQQMQRRHEELMGGMRMLQGMLQRVSDPSGVTRPSDIAISVYHSNDGKTCL